MFSIEMDRCYSKIQVNEKTFKILKGNPYKNLVWWYFQKYSGVLEENK